MADESLAGLPLRGDAGAAAGASSGGAWGMLDVNPAKVGVDNPMRPRKAQHPFGSWAELEALATAIRTALRADDPVRGRDRTTTGGVDHTHAVALRAHRTPPFGLSRTANTTQRLDEITGGRTLGIADRARCSGCCCRSSATAVTGGSACDAVDAAVLAPGTRSAEVASAAWSRRASAAACGGPGVGAPARAREPALG